MICNSIELQYTIFLCSYNSKLLKLRRSRRLGVPKIGINQLNFNQEVKSTIDNEIVVGVPIKPNKKLL